MASSRRKHEEFGSNVMEFLEFGFYTSFQRRSAVKRGLEGQEPGWFTRGAKTNPVAKTQLLHAWVGQQPPLLTPEGNAYTCR